MSRPRAGTGAEPAARRDHRRDDVSPGIPEGPPADAGSWLLPAARGAIAEALGLDAGWRPAPGWATAPGACFVTLTVRGGRPERLRGCIGSLQAWRPLAADVRGNAVAAATRDHRFPPVQAAELEDLRIEVSVLSGSTPIAFAGQQDLLAGLRPGVDGLVLAWGGHRGTFLPQVWEQLPDPRDFLDQLKRKAGLPASWWSEDAVVERYTVTAWEEP